MRKTIVILVCLLLFVSCLPLFARGRWGYDAHLGSSGSHQAANEHRWHGSTKHPSFHGWRGWSQAPGKGPAKHTDDPTEPPGDPVEDPGDKPGTDPGGTPGDKGGGDPLDLLLLLDPHTGSFPG